MWVIDLYHRTAEARGSTPLFSIPYNPYTASITAITLSTFLPGHSQLLSNENSAFGGKY
ncbi:MAG: hypothetical protein HC908_15580 [Calothrix sp. SM1_7_51]|nr:hypothetical protein [Calothrix sp. SM1_7_51]